jgi:hypothetical protein
MLIISSAGSLLIGDTRKRSAISCASESLISPSSTEGANEDIESFSWIMRESLSSSITPRSGDVEAEDAESSPSE